MLNPQLKRRSRPSKKKKLNPSVFPLSLGKHTSISTLFFERHLFAKLNLPHPAKKMLMVGVRTPGVALRGFYALIIGGHSPQCNQSPTRFDLSPKNEVCTPNGPTY